jgi:hypothetical protein
MSEVCEELVAFGVAGVFADTLGVLWSQGKISFLESVLFIQAGLLPANAFMVGMGKRFGLPLIHRRPF